MAEDGDMNKIVKDELTSKNYTYHLLKFVTDKRSSDQEFLLPLMNYLNQDIYFNQLKKVYNQNIHNKIKADEVIITQIDGFLNAFSSELNQGNKNDKLVYLSEKYPQLKLRIIALKKDSKGNLIIATRNNGVFILTKKEEIRNRILERC